MSFSYILLDYPNSDLFFLEVRTVGEMKSAFGGIGMRGIGMRESMVAFVFAVQMLS